VSNDYAQSAFDSAGASDPFEQLMLPLSWLEAQQHFALAQSPLLCSSPTFTELCSGAAGASDNSWSSIGNPVTGGEVHSGAIALGAFTESAYVYPAGQIGVVGAYFKTPKTGMLYAASRACVNAFATNAGSRQFLICVSNGTVNIGLAYVPSVSTTNWVLCVDTAGTISTSVVSSEPRRLSAVPDRDFILHTDGVSWKCWTGDILSGIPNRVIGELTSTEPITDSSGFTVVGHVRINVEAGGPKVAYDKLLGIAPLNR